MIDMFQRFLLGLLVAASVKPCTSQVRVLVNQVGYETRGPKQAIISGSAQDHPGQFALVDADTQKTVLKGDLLPAGQVHAWDGFVFWTADFSAWQTSGHYLVQIMSVGAESCPFEINDNILERNTLSNVVYSFKGQRASGLLDKADRHLPVPGAPSSFVDVHGGWYDATGDYGIHLSHQNPTSYFNPQQVPLVAWSLLSRYLALADRHDDDFSEYQ